MLLILLILIFIRPFISSLAFPYLNLIYSVILLVFLIVWLIQEGIPIQKLQTLQYPLVLFVLALIISSIFSIDKINSLKEIYRYMSGLLIFLTGIYLKDEYRIRVIKVMVLTGFLISLLAIYQYSFGFRHILDYLSKEKISSTFALDYIQRQRVYFPFVTPNILGGYLAMIIPLILALWDKKKKLFLNPFFFFLISVSFALLLTKSLGALLSLFLALIIYFYLQGNLDRKRLLFVVGFLIIIGLIFLLRHSVTKQHILPTFSLTMRLNYWIDTLKIIKIAPWQGFGLGNFNLPFTRYAHNSYLQIWAEMGILGIISILWLIFVVFKSSLKNIKDSPTKHQIAGLITANAVFLIHNLVDFSFFLPEINLIWWLILGLTLSLKNS